METDFQPGDHSREHAQHSAPPDSSDQKAACLRRYLANMAALYRADTALAVQIDAIPFAALPQFEAARDGSLTVSLTADDNRAIYAHSRYKPLEEAREFVAALPPANNPTFFISGIGLGYHLPELYGRFEAPLLIVADDDLPLIKAALCCVDLVEIIRENRIIFLTSAEKTTLHDRLSHRHANIMLGTQFITLPHARRRRTHFHAQMAAAMADFVAYCRLQIVTILANSRITCKNVAMNLGAYLSNPGIAHLKNSAAGLPAIVIAAGPSLARNVHLLNELRPRAVLVAVQTVFKSLLARGCPPHFVTSLDFNEVSAQFFRDLGRTPETILVAEPKATWHVIDAYPGRKHLLHNRFVDDLLREHAPKRAALKAGSTVAQLAFYLAQHLGCDPIIFVGQDLAYSEGLYYPPGMPIDRVWEPELGRFYTLEMKQWERICRGRPILRTVKDIHGRDTYTDEQLFSYAEQFQSDFLSSPAKIIHACEGGMKLAGTQIMTLRQAADQFCTRDLPQDLIANLSETHFRRAGSGDSYNTSSSTQFDFQSARNAIQSRLNELHEIHSICLDMSPLLEQLVGLVEKPNEFNRLVVRVDALRTRIQRHDLTYRLVLDVSQNAELRRYAADRRIAVVEHETPETARARLQRDREFVAAFTEGCEYLQQMLPEALDRLGSIGEQA